MGGYSDWDEAPTRQPKRREELFGYAWEAGRDAGIAKGVELGVPRAYFGSGEQWTCPSCNETTESSVHIGRFEFCKCQREVHEQVEQAYIAANRQTVANSLLLASGIPPRHRKCSFDNFTHRQGTEKGRKLCEDYAADFQLGVTSDGLLLIGPFGSGKSHLAIATARAIVEKSLVQVHFVSTVDLLSRIKATFGKSSADDPLHDAKQAEMLVLDDLAQENTTDWAREVIMNLVSHRYEQELPTIFTTNYGDSQLEERLGGAVVSRLYEMCSGAIVTATDYRVEIARQRMGA